MSLAAIAKLVSYQLLTTVWPQFVIWTKSTLSWLVWVVTLAKAHRTWELSLNSQVRCAVGNVKINRSWGINIFPSMWIIFNGSVDKATFNFTNHTLQWGQNTNPKVHRALFKNWPFDSFHQHCNHPCLVWCFRSILNSLFRAPSYKTLKERGEKHFWHPHCLDDLFYEVNLLKSKTNFIFHRESAMCKRSKGM